MTGKLPESKDHRWAWLILGTIAFGLLMGIRPEFHSMWSRAAIAGCAFGIWGVSLSRFRRGRI